jgi:hypothetical protein
MYAKDFPKKEISSPFRTDKHPSFGYHYKTGRWKWKDNTTGENGDIFDYIAKAHGLGSLQDVLQFINTNMALGAGTVIQPQSSRILNSARLLGNGKQETKEKFLQAVTRPWNKYDFEIWNRWLITPDILKFYHVRPAHQAFAERELIWVHKLNNPLYFYHFPVTKHIKFYRPLGDKGKKFFGNTNNLQDIYGYYQCDIKVRRPRLLILTNSGKECMYYRAWHMDAMAIHGEGSYFDPDFIRHLKKYCGRIVSFYDNDPAGRHGAWELRDRYDIPAFFIAKEHKGKNITDLHWINPKLAYEYIKYLNQWNIYHSICNNYRGFLSGTLRKGTLHVV